MALLSPALITTLIDSAYRVSFTTEYFASHPVTEVSCVQLCQQCIPLLNALLSSSPSLTLLCLSSFCSSQLSQWCHVFLLKPQNHAWPLLPLRLLLPFPFICKSNSVCSFWSNSPHSFPFLLTHCPAAALLKHSWTFQVPFGVTMHPQTSCAGCSQPGCGQGDSPFWSHPSFAYQYVLSLFFTLFCRRDFV